MAEVRCDFTWQPVADSLGYRVFYGSTELTDQPDVGFSVVLGLIDGDHTFSIEAYNDAGAGQRVSVTRSFVAPTAPGPVPNFDVTLTPV